MNDNEFHIRPVNYTLSYDARVSTAEDGSCSCGKAMNGYETATHAMVEGYLEKNEEGNLEAIGSGTTRDVWDAQETVTTDDGLPLLVCVDGHFYVNENVKKAGD